MWFYFCPEMGIAITEITKCILLKLVSYQGNIEVINGSRFLYLKVTSQTHFGWNRPQNNFNN